MACWHIRFALHNAIACYMNFGLCIDKLPCKLTIESAGLGVLGETYPPNPVLVFGDGNVKGKACEQRKLPLHC